MTDEINSPIDWLSSTTAQRKKLYPVAKAIKDISDIDDWNKFMALFMSVPIDYNHDYRGSIRSGRLSRKNAYDLYNWVAANHLDIAQRLASDIFPKSMSTPWEEFISTHGAYDILKTVNPLSLGLTRRDGDLPIAEDPIKLGEPYCFTFKSEITGQALIIESHEGGDWNPIPVGDTDHDLCATIRAEQMTVPWDSQSNKAVALREHQDKGLRQFVLLIGSDNLINDIKSKIAIGQAITPTALNEIAHACISSEDTWEVHRLNVVFVG